MSEKTVVSRTKTIGEIKEKIEVASRKTSTADRIWMSALWLGVGAMVHAWFLGPDFDSRSLWSWGYLLAWPLPMIAWLAIQVAIIGLWLLLAIAAVAVTYWAAKFSAEYVRGRRQ